MLVKNVKILFFMTVFEARRFVVFPSEIFASIIARLAEVSLYVAFWLIVSKYANSGGLSSSVIISYYLIINGITAFFFTHIDMGAYIIRLIKYGELNQSLIRPVSPILTPWSQKAGRNLLYIILGGLQVIVGVAIVGANFQLSIILPLVVINTVVINLAFNVIVGCIGFYFVEAGGFRNTFVHIYNLLGGVLIPLFLMPASIARALQFTPFPAGQYHLTILLQGKEAPSLGFVCIGFLWAIVLAGFAAWFWKYSLAKYEAVGI